MNGEPRRQDIEIAVRKVGLPGQPGSQRLFGHTFRIPHPLMTPYAAASSLYVYHFVNTGTPVTYTVLVENVSLRSHAEQIQILNHPLMIWFHLGNRRQPLSNGCFATGLGMPNKCHALHPAGRSWHSPARSPHRFPPIRHVWITAHRNPCAALEVGGVVFFWVGGWGVHLKTRPTLWSLAPHMVCVWPRP